MTPTAAEIDRLTTILVITLREFPEDVSGILTGYSSALVGMGYTTEQASGILRGALNKMVAAEFGRAGHTLN